MGYITHHVGPVGFQIVRGYPAFTKKKKTYGGSHVGKQNGQTKPAKRTMSR